jgi:hypothetical protein
MQRIAESAAAGAKATIDGVLYTKLHYTTAGHGKEHWNNDSVLAVRCSSSSSSSKQGSGALSKHILPDPLYP